MGPFFGTERSVSHPLPLDRTKTVQARREWGPGGRKGGSHALERVALITWNQWPTSVGMSGPHPAVLDSGRRPPMGIGRDQPPHTVRGRT